MRHTHSPWLNSDILELIYKRDHSKKLAISLKHDDCWKTYKTLRNQVNANIKDAKKKYFHHAIISSKMTVGKYGSISNNSFPAKVKHVL